MGVALQQVIPGMVGKRITAYFELVKPLIEFKFDTIQTRTNNMFELADRLVGIYKTHDVTKSVTINPKKLAGSTAPNKAGSSESVKVRHLLDYFADTHISWPRTKGR